MAFFCINYRLIGAYYVCQKKEKYFIQKDHLILNDFPLMYLCMCDPLLDSKQFFSSFGGLLKISLVFVCKYVCIGKLYIYVYT